MERRRLLALAAGASVALGGCLDDDPPRPGLGEIVLHNDHENDLELQLAVEKDNEIVHDETHQLEGTDGGDPVTTDIVEDWMGDEAYYVITMTIAGSDEQRRFSTGDATDFVSEWGDDDCFTVMARVSADDVRFAMGTADSCAELESR